MSLAEDAAEKRAGEGDERGNDFVFRQRHRTRWAGRGNKTSDVSSLVSFVTDTVAGDRPREENNGQSVHRFFRQGTANDIVSFAEDTALERSRCAMQLANRQLHHSPPIRPGTLAKSFRQRS